MSCGAQLLSAFCGCKKKAIFRRAFFMTNSLPTDPQPPRREPASLGELKLDAVPRLRIIAWLVIGLLTLAGIVLFFMYGDFVSPVLAMLEGADACCS